MVSWWYVRSHTGIESSPTGDKNTDISHGPYATRESTNALPTATSLYTDIPRFSSSTDAFNSSAQR